MSGEKHICLQIKDTYLEESKKLHWTRNVLKVVFSRFYGLCSHVHLAMFTAPHPSSFPLIRCANRHLLITPKKQCTLFTNFKIELLCISYIKSQLILVTFVPPSPLAPSHSPRLEFIHSLFTLRPLVPN